MLIYVEDDQELRRTLQSLANGKARVIKKNPVVPIPANVSFKV